MVNACCRVAEALSPFVNCARLSIASIAFLLLPAIGRAQPSADLKVEFVDPLPMVTEPGTYGNFSFRVTNLGPDRAGGPDDDDYPIIVTTNPIDFLVGIGAELFFVEESLSSDCIILMGNINPIPGNPPQVKYTAFLHPLDPGEAAFCEVSYAVSPFLDGDRLIRWRLYTSTVEDLNQENNYIYQLFRIAPRPPIPTLTPAGAVVLVLMLFAAFVFIRRRAT